LVTTDRNDNDNDNKKISTMALDGIPVHYHRFMTSRFPINIYVTSFCIVEKAGGGPFYLKVTDEWYESDR
jgi:hypothetical protein